MKSKLIGTYDLGRERVKLFLSPGCDGTLFLTPAEIHVGCELEWTEAFDALVHEALEFAMIREGVRFDRSPDFSNSHDNYLFVMLHPQFAQVCARASGFIAACTRDLSRAWKESRK